MVLQTVDITKSFGEKQVLRGISLSVGSGKALGVLGRNGAGKTTLIRIVMQVFRADSGQVLIDGAPMKREKLRIGYLPEERGMYPKKTVTEQLLYFGMLAGLSRGEAKKSAQTLMERLEVTEYAEKKLLTLSKGNQQKIQFVATLIADPDIVVLDEPFSGLDPVNAMLLKDLVREMISRGKIVFFSSHQMNYIEEFCDDIAIMSEGKIALGGSLKDIKRRADRSQIDIRSPKAMALREMLESAVLPFVASCSMEDDETLSVRLTDAAEKGRLMQAVSAMNADVDAFAVHEPSLSDIFVQYTRDDVTEGKEAVQ